MTAVDGHHENHFSDMEFSGFFDLTTNALGDRILYLKYFLFAKYNDLIYIDVRSVGYIIMPFEELLKNKILKMYYDLSLLLVKDKNKIVEKVENGNRIWDAEITEIYKGQRNWYIDCAYILNKQVVTDKQLCYFELDPYEWKDPYSLWVDPYTGERIFVNSSSEIEWFNYNFKVRYGYEIVNFEKRTIDYVDICVDYVAALMEKELDEISAIEDDKHNIIKLIAFNDKKDMNSDIFQIILGNLIGSPSSNTYTPYLENLENNKETAIALIAST